MALAVANHPHVPVIVGVLEFLARPIVHFWAMPAWMRMSGWLQPQTVLPATVQPSFEALFRLEFISMKNTLESF